MPSKNCFMPLSIWRISRPLLSRKLARAPSRRFSTTNTATRITGTHAMAANAQVSFCLMFMISPAGIYSFGKAETVAVGVAWVFMGGEVHAYPRYIDCAVTHLRPGRRFNRCARRPAHHVASIAGFSRWFRRWFPSGSDARWHGMGFANRCRCARWPAA